MWFSLWKNEVDYGTVVCELCIMEHVMSTQRMVAYSYLWLYINCTTQGQLIIPQQQGRWKWIMTVLVSLPRSVTENPMDTTWNPCHNQFKLKKETHKNAYLPNMRIFEIYISFACSHFPKFQNKIVSFHNWLISWLKKFKSRKLTMVYPFRSCLSHQE